MGAGVLGLPSAEDPDPFEPSRVSVAGTVVVAVAVLTPLTAPVAVGINPATTPAPTTFVERATPATVSAVLVRTCEPAVVDTVCVTVWVTTLELAWATCVMVWVTLGALAARLTVWVTVVVAVDTAEPASWVTPEALLVTRETVLVTTAAAVSGAWIGTGPAPRAVPVVAVPALSTAPAVGVATLAAGAVGVGGVTGAVEESSCVAVVTTLPTAPGAGMAAPDSSATASVKGKEHRMTAVVNRALRRPESRGEGL